MPPQVSTMTEHIRTKWTLYAIVMQTLYMILNPGPIHTALTKLLCND